MGHLFFVVLDKIGGGCSYEPIGYAANLVKQFSWNSWEPTPTATPYHSGVLIDAIAPSTDDDTFPAQLPCTEAYQSLISSIGWLATARCPDLALLHSFLSSYNGKPSSGHIQAALYALHYIHSTHDHGITFSSATTAPINTYVHFPNSMDVKAYSDAKPPSAAHCAPITKYSDACWGSQIGLAICDSTLLPLFKFRSMSGGIIFRQGRPIAWLAVQQQQERVSLSSCEAEICATNEISKMLMALCHLGGSLCNNGHDIPYTLEPSQVYNDNEACVCWSQNMTTKQIWHMEMRKNSVHKWVQDVTLRILHVKSKINPEDIFTKEMRDGTHFWRLRDSFMC